jgi:hypothetical protein
MQYTVAPRCGVCGLVNTAGNAFCPRCRSDLRIVLPPGYAPPAQAPRPQPAFPSPAPYGYQYGAQYRQPGQPYGQLTHSQMHAAIPHKSHGALPWLAAIAGIVFLAVTLSVFGLVLSGGGLTNCPIFCPGPPSTGSPLPPPHLYTSKTFGYQVQYYDGNPWLPASQSRRIIKVAEDDKSIGWVFDATGVSWSPGGGQWPYGFTGESAQGRSAQRVVADYQASRYPQAQLVYGIPGAGLGFRDGWGGVYDLIARSSTGVSVHSRLFLIGSVKGSTAVVFEGLGPYSPSNSGHPNPSGTRLANFFAPLPNDVVMPGDPPR